MASAMASFHPYDDNLIAAMPDRDECPTAF